MARGLVFLFAALLAAAAASAESREEAATAAAGEWLALLDGGAYQESWEQASTLFRQAVTATQWEESVSAARRPFGALVSREVLSATFAESLPGAPDGEYVVIQYRAVFEKKSGAVETVTPMRDAGAWRVSGYFIK